MMWHVRRNWLPVLLALFTTVGLPLGSHSREVVAQATDGSPTALDPSLIELLNSDPNLRRRYRKLLEMTGGNVLPILESLSSNWESIDERRACLTAIAAFVEDSPSSLDDVAWSLERSPDTIVKGVDALQELLDSASRLRLLEESRDEFTGELRLLLRKHEYLRWKLAALHALRIKLKPADVVLSKPLDVESEEWRNELWTTETQLAALFDWFSDGNRLGLAPATIEPRLIAEARKCISQRIVSLFEVQAELDARFDALVKQRDTLDGEQERTALDIRVADARQRLQKLEWHLSVLLARVPEVLDHPLASGDRQRVLQRVTELVAVRNELESRLVSLRGKVLAATPKERENLDAQIQAARIRREEAEARLGSLFDLLPESALAAEIIGFRQTVSEEASALLESQREREAEYRQLVEDRETTPRPEAKQVNDVLAAAERRLLDEDIRLASLARLLKSGSTREEIESRLADRLDSLLRQWLIESDGLRPRSDERETERARREELDRKLADLQRLRAGVERLLPPEAFERQYPTHPHSIGHGFRKPAGGWHVSGVDRPGMGNRPSTGSRPGGGHRPSARPSTRPGASWPAMSRPSMVSGRIDTPFDAERWSGIGAMTNGLTANDHALKAAAGGPPRLLANMATAGSRPGLPDPGGDQLPGDHQPTFVGPLPKDSLYARVSGNYGSTPVIAIDKIIEEGSLFDQRILQFDDFAATNTESVPEPAASESVSISYGVTSAEARQLSTRGLLATAPGLTLNDLQANGRIPAELLRAIQQAGVDPSELKLEWTAGPPMIKSPGLSSPLPLRELPDGIGVFSHREPTHFVEVAVRARKNAPPLEGAKVPLNVVFVVDVSGSMEGQKIDDAKNAVVKLFEQLEDGDSLGVVAFDDEVKTVLKSTRKSDLDRSDMTAAINDLVAVGGTDIALGIGYGIAEVNRHGSPNTVNHVAVLTDGNPTSGLTDWNEIRRLIAHKARGSVNLSVFGFGADANREELSALAGTTGGSFTLVVNPESVHASLRQQVARRNHIVGLNLQMQLALPPEFQLLHFFGHIPVDDPAIREEILHDVEVARQQARNLLRVKPPENLIEEEEGIRLFIPDLVAGETYILVFEVAALPNITPESFGRATLQYVDVLKRSVEQSEMEIDEDGLLLPNLVAEHAVQLWTSEVVFAAMEDLYRDEPDVARDRINRHVDRLRLAAGKIRSEHLNNDRVTLQKFGTLLDNLGKPLNVLDKSYDNLERHALHKLSEFGRMRNGYDVYRIVF